MPDSTNPEKPDLLSNYAYRPYIKDIYIELPKYEYHHHPIGDDNLEKERFVGRESIHESFLSVLLNGAQNGAYLVTGYRGMGKTSFVKRILNEYKKEASHKKGQVVEKLEISFSQTELKDTDILRQITKKLIEQAEKNPLIKTADSFSLSNILWFTFWILFFLFIVFSLKWCDSSPTSTVKSIGSRDTITVKIPLTEKKDSLVVNLLSIPDTTSKYWPETIKLFSQNLAKHFLEGEVTKVLGVILAIGFISLLIAYSFFIFIRLLVNGFNLVYSNKFDNKIVKVLGWLRSSPWNLIRVLSCLLYYSFGYLISNVFKKEFTPFYSFIFLIIFPLLLLILSKLRFIYETTIGERIIHKQLLDLYERCNASITNESGIQSVSEQLPLGFIQRSVKQYAIANAKDIEYELIDIFKKYRQFESYKKRFVIVFDELDKVEPSLSKGYYFDDTKTLEQYEFAQVQLSELRERKKAIINILSSLKYFVTEAHARFIFIAGREMFDAALADIADRQSFISSIFHQIIYVDSFLKDSSTNHDVTPDTKKLTDLVEKYLTNVLINNPTRDTSLLKQYFEQLEKDTSLTQEQRLKVIFTLQNFIIFLTYRSNGSPKKLVKLIEDHIINRSKIDSNELSTVVKSAKTDWTENGKICFLRFDYKQQYRFAYITYLYRPFIMASGSYIKKYSDNVLVATPYLMDHIIKFHPFAFSIQNLELLPEVISSNRNPIVRHFIEDIIQFLRQNHVRETELSIFDFKFYNKTANELSYLSKIFEEESAAFNFSLDEMYYIKLYLKNKIRELRKNYSEFNSGDNSQPVYSISFLNNLLGDSHYFDQEFDNAIVSYLDGLQALRSVSADYQTSEWFVMTIKFKLKIGLIYEKIKTPDVAITYYNDAINDTRKYFLSSSKDNSSIPPLLHLDNPSNLNKITYKTSIGHLLQISYQAYAASVYAQEKLDVGGINLERINKQIEDVKRLHSLRVGTSNLHPLPLADFYNDLGTLLYYKNYTEGNKSQNEENSISLLRHLYTEKLPQHQLNHQDFKDNKDFRYSYHALKCYKDALKELLPIENGKSESIEELCKKASEIIGDYHNNYNSNHLKMIGFALSNIGDVLYSVYKAKTEIGVKVLNDLSEIWDAKSTLFKKNVETFKKKYGNYLNYYDPSDIREHNLHYQYYSTELINIIESSWFIEKEKDEIVKQINQTTVLTEVLERVKKPYRRMAFWDQACSDFFSKGSNKDDLEIIIFIYYLSGRFYSKAGRSVSFSFKLRKILQIIRNNVQKNDSNDKLIKFLEDTVLSLILEVSSWNSSSTDRPQMYKFKYYENLEGAHPLFYRKYNYSHISNSPDTQEAILIFADLKFKLSNHGQLNISKLTEIEVLSLIHQESTIFSQHTRLMQLDLQDKINRVLMKKIFPSWKEWENNYVTLNHIGDVEEYQKNLKKYTENIKMSEENKKFYIKLVSNSIFCLYQTIQILRIFTENPYLSYSLLANFHRRLGRWYKHYYLAKTYKFDEGKDRNENVESILNKILGTEAMVTIDSASQFQLALQYYHKAKEMHSNGATYHHQMSNYLYLEGDYDDNLYHFGIALERQQINSGKIRERIKELEKESAESPLYKYESFANFENKP